MCREGLYTTHNYDTTETTIHNSEKLTHLSTSTSERLMTQTADRCKRRADNTGHRDNREQRQREDRGHIHRQSIRFHRPQCIYTAYNISGIRIPYQHPYAGPQVPVRLWQSPIAVTLTGTSTRKPTSTTQPHQEYRRADELQYHYQLPATLPAANSPLPFPHSYLSDSIGPSSIKQAAAGAGANAKMKGQKE